MFPSYLEVEKTGSQLFRALQTLLQLFGERKKWIPAIWRPKNVVHNSQEQGKRLLHQFKVRKTGSQPVGARKKCFPAIWKWKNWFLSISSLTNTFTASWREKKWIPAIWRQKNIVHNCQEQGKRL